MRSLLHTSTKKADHSAQISRLVRYASDKEKEELIREITRKANEDQRWLVEQYQMQKKAA